MKTQKKVANIVSPLSVLNSFASLTVEDAEDECTVDNTPHVYNVPTKSREGPKKGSAGDSKKVVLNSLLAIPLLITLKAPRVSILKSRFSSYKGL